MFAGHAEKDRQSRAGSHEDRVVVFVAHQLIDGYALADDDVGLELDAHAAQVVHFFFHNCLGQAELRNAIDEHAAELVQGFKNADAMALLDQVSRGREAGRTAADNGHALARGGRVGGQSKLAALALEVGDKPLQVANGDGRALLAQHASALALVLLRADAAGDGGQNVVLAHFGRRGKIVAGIDEGHYFLDLYAHRAVDDAGGLGACDAARGLGEGVGRLQAQIDFFKVAAADQRVELRHVRAQNLHPFLEGKNIHCRAGKSILLSHDALPP